MLFAPSLRQRRLRTCRARGRALSHLPALRAAGAGAAGRRGAGGGRPRHGQDAAHRGAAAQVCVCGGGWNDPTGWLAGWVTGRMGRLGEHSHEIQMRDGLWMLRRLRAASWGACTPAATSLWGWAGGSARARRSTRGGACCARCSITTPCWASCTAYAAPAATLR